MVIVIAIIMGHGGVVVSAKPAMEIRTPSDSGSNPGHNAGPARLRQSFCNKLEVKVSTARRHRSPIRIGLDEILGQACEV